MTLKPENAVGVFISYSHEDRFAADTLAGKLKEFGYFPWVDFDALVGGDEWKNLIDNALAQSFAVVVLMTPDSVRSTWVDYECTRAKVHGCTIIPVMVRTCEIPDILRDYHYLDFRAGLDPAFMQLHRALMTTLMQRSRPGFPHETSGAQSQLALVVEDAEYYQDIIRSLLVEMGLEVHVAGTRNEAASLIQNNPYVFIALDMKLGPHDELGQDGVFLLDIIKRYQPTTPIVIVTQLPWQRDRIREFFVKYEIRDLMDKPFDQEELRQLVKKHVKGVS